MMSDDHNPQTDDNELDGEPSTTDATTIPAADDVQPAENETAGDEPKDGEPGRADPGGWTRRLMNMQIGGHLVMHHVSRDVIVVVDGDSALRAIEYFAHREGRGDLDLLSSNTSTAECGWVSVDLRGVIGLSWIPGLGTVDSDDRLTFDPLMSAA